MLKIQQVLLNENGENVLNDYFDSIIFKTNYVLVTKAHMTGIYDRTSFKQILKCEWETITFERGYIIASRISQIGVFESSGQNILHSYNWDKVKLFDEGILVTKDSKQGFFRYDGTMILDCIWKRIVPYHQILLAYQGHGAKAIKFNYDGLKEEC